MAAELIRNSYGKERVRLTHVRRGEGRTAVHQLTVAVELEGDFEATYRKGDNRLVIATDSMKNTVYVLARQHAMECIERFALDLARHFVARYGHVSAAEVRIEEQVWEPMTVGGQAHPTAFVGGGSEVRTCRVRIGRDGAVAGNQGAVLAESGLDGLLVLKTSDSAFCGYLRDEFATLPDAPDRLLCTVVKADWRYRTEEPDWSRGRETVRRALLDCFAGHDSLSVQQTLFAMGESALAACPDVEEIRLILPNKHHLPLDLTPFGLDNPNMVFCPVDEPYGCIRGTVRRGSGLSPE